MVWFFLYEIPGTGKFSETENRLDVTRAWWEGESGTHFLMVIEPFEGDDLKISETVLMIAQPCEYNLGHQIGWNGKFYVIYFTF